MSNSKSLILLKSCLKDLYIFTRQRTKCFCAVLMLYKYILCLAHVTPIKEKASSLSNVAQEITQCPNSSGKQNNHLVISFKQKNDTSVKVKQQRRLAR